MGNGRVSYSLILIHGYPSAPLPPAEGATAGAGTWSVGELPGPAGRAALSAGRRTPGPRPGAARRQRSGAVAAGDVGPSAAGVGGPPQTRRQDTDAHPAQLARLVTRPRGRHRQATGDCKEHGQTQRAQTSVNCNNNLILQTFQN